MTHLLLLGLLIHHHPHHVSLSWTASTSQISHYNIYRCSTACPSFSLLGQTSATAFTDSAVTAGATYTYEATAVDASGAESIPSNQASATVPRP